MLINYGPIDPTSQYVEAGYDTFKHSFQILKSASSNQDDVSMLNTTSNVNVPGRWAFWVNQGSSYTTTSDLNIKVSEACKANASQECTKNLLSQIDNITTEVLPKEVVEDKLEFLITQPNSLLVGKTNQDELVSSFNNILKATDKLMSTLVRNVETNSSVSISLKTIEARVFEIGPSCSLTEIPQLETPDAKMDIDLIGISKSKKNQGHAAVAFMSYTNMSNSSLFSTTTNTMKHMMSTVVSATLPRTNNTNLTKPVNFTLRHTAVFNLHVTPSCVYWKETDWVTDGCTLIKSNITHSVCSCDHLSTFALIMQTKPSENDHRLDEFSMVAEALGLVFLVLTLLTFALCRSNPRVINTARIQLCISLLLAHFFFLLTQILLKSKSLQPLKLACAVMAGVLHFLFLSAFVWMFIEALMLFIAVKNLSRPKSKQKKLLNWKILTVIGYMVALLVVGVSAGVVPDGYGSEKCWLKQDKEVKWSFLGPVSFILASNTILFSLIAISLGYSLTHLNSQVSQIKQTRTVFFKTMAQFVILGCPWILGFFTADSKALEIIFVILISQQGTFIFIVHCVLSNEVKQKYTNLLGGFQANFSPTTITETSTTQG
ncbi:adhesion G protein-coupled receptor E3-like [Colossoma macropomum]|uniref:adhesion G protein-coupled receptor E3-like n=1 Tax=Colossoma macropomum TaxID=42526 RepID=UPI0018653AA2|nr:adhesion G protein-coupled receptor E3-like [Colossoma macropomum]